MQQGTAAHDRSAGPLASQRPNSEAMTVGEAASHQCIHRCERRACRPIGVAGIGMPENRLTPIGGLPVTATHHRMVMRRMNEGDGSVDTATLERTVTHRPGVGEVVIEPPEPVVPSRAGLRDWGVDPPWSRFVPT
jgi:hypothetical protein